MVYHVSVQQEGDWYIGRVLERSGVTTQGRSIDELVRMLRDAIEHMWDDKDAQLELLLPSEIKIKSSQTRRQAVSASSA